MSAHIVLLVLLAALLHATWNVIVKGGDNKLFECGMNALGGCLGGLALICALGLPFPADPGLLVLSLLFHFGYYCCITATYRVADLSLCYPVMRGTAPVLTALALCLLGDTLTARGGLGVLVLCAGIVSLAVEQRFVRRAPTRGLLLALRTSVCIMCYTLADGFGARAAGDALAYACWLHVGNVLALHCCIVPRQAREYAGYVRRFWRHGLVGGLAGFASYGIAIWAMSVAPMALVAALRETSVIFGMLMAVCFLGEKLTLLRVGAIGLVLAGAMLLRLG